MIVASIKRPSGQASERLAGSRRRAAAEPLERVCFEIVDLHVPQAGRTSVTAGDPSALPAQAAEVWHFRESKTELPPVSRAKPTEGSPYPIDQTESLGHSRWECKYHVVFIPNCRRKVLCGELRRHLGAVFRTLTEQKECRVEEGHLMPDHVHMKLSIPPKYAGSLVVGFIKGKSAIHIARTFGERKRNFAGQHFWARARGFIVSTVGRDDEVIRQYIRNQEVEDKRQEELRLL